jgi:hypothetical protein
LFLKTENSRRVAESRSVCVGLNPAFFSGFSLGSVFAEKIEFS